MRGTLPLRYCAGRIDGGIPTWRLPVGGHDIGLVSDDYGGDVVVPDGHGAPVLVPGFRGDAGVDWVSGPGGGVKRVRLNRKTPAHLVRQGILGIQSRPPVWKRLGIREHPGFALPDVKARRVHQSKLCMRFELGSSCVARVSVVDIQQQKTIKQSGEAPF